MAAALLAGYLMGSLPFAFWFAALQGKAWSGREPLWRLGPVPAGLVLLLDFAKGVFAVALGEFLARDYTGGLAAGAAAAFAHALSPWLGLRRAGSLLAPWASSSPWTRGSSSWQAFPPASSSSRAAKPTPPSSPSPWPCPSPPSSSAGPSPPALRPRPQPRPPLAPR